MEIILLEDVKALGKKGEIVKKVPEEQLLAVLREELEHWNDDISK